MMVRASVLRNAPRIEPGAEDRFAAQKLLQETAGESHLVLKLADGRELPLPEALAKALLALAGELSTGHAVRVLAAETTLSPAEAAEGLDLSRLFVVRLLDEGAIPSEHLPDSRHRAVRLEDVLISEATAAEDFVFFD
ncbi:DNA-binding protein [Nocardiopsis valliformis]|uniref:DNA-binding protein n=1 Tax=Nocardiopsis valliformis TaxID=239974 RepID=UPI0012692DD7|nr:DNA-binding protein [Nocardiopsis valliformis]